MKPAHPRPAVLGTQKQGWCHPRVRLKLFSLPCTTARWANDAVCTLCWVQQQWRHCSGELPAEQGVLPWSRASGGHAHAMAVRCALDTVPPACLHPVHTIFIIFSLTNPRLVKTTTNICSNNGKRFQGKNAETFSKGASPAASGRHPTLRTMAGGGGAWAVVPRRSTVTACFPKLLRFLRECSSCPSFCQEERHEEPLKIETREKCCQVSASQFITHFS